MKKTALRSEAKNTVANPGTKLPRESMRKRLMLVEDDVVIRDNYTDILVEVGFEVDVCGNRHDAMAHFCEVSPDIALLDIGLDGERDGGFQLCSDLRQLSPSLPIIFLTSRSEDLDRISGLRCGADDYLTKDISIDYLVVRIEALLRRIESLANNSNYPSTQGSAGNVVRGSLKIDESKLVAFWKDQPVDLTLTQLWILKELASDSGQVKRYSKLMRAANLVVEPNTITAHIKTIRDRFKAIDIGFDCIKTERGLGYRWVEFRSH
ncbi:MAG: response regulator [Gammaproteobacteria bacterium]